MTSETTPDHRRTAAPPPAPAAGGDCRLMLALVLAAICRASRMTDYREPQVHCRIRSAADRVASPTGKPFRWTIRFADGGERQFDGVAWRDGMTVDDLMTTVSRQPGGITMRCMAPAKWRF